MGNKCFHTCANLLCDGFGFGHIPDTFKWLNPTKSSTGAVVVVEAMNELSSCLLCSLDFGHIELSSTNLTSPPGRGFGHVLWLIRKRFKDFQISVLHLRYMMPSRPRKSLSSFIFYWRLSVVANWKLCSSLLWTKNYGLNYASYHVQSVTHLVTQYMYLVRLRLSLMFIFNVQVTCGEWNLRLKFWASTLFGLGYHTTSHFTMKLHK